MAARTDVVLGGLIALGIAVGGVGVTVGLAMSGDIADLRVSVANNESALDNVDANVEEIKIGIARIDKNIDDLVERARFEDTDPNRIMASMGLDLSRIGVILRVMNETCLFAYPEPPPNITPNKLKLYAGDPSVVPVATRQVAEELGFTWKDIRPGMSAFCK